MTEQLEELRQYLDAVRHYAKHDKGCPKVGWWPNAHACTCGLDDVLRAVDARMAKA